MHSPHARRPFAPALALLLLLQVTVLVAGKGCGAAAKAASSIDGVSKVLVADDAVFEGGVAETLSKLVVDVTGKGGYDAVVGPSSHYVRNVLPRAAAKLDVAPISDVTAVLDGGKAFERPMYAGESEQRARGRG